MVDVIIGGVVIVGVFIDRKFNVLDFFFVVLGSIRKELMKGCFFFVERFLVFCILVLLRRVVVIVVDWVGVRFVKSVVEGEEELWFVGKRGVFLGGLVVVFFCKLNWCRFFSIFFLLWLFVKIGC